MAELTDFYNDGSGWICRQCERDLEREQKPEPTHSRSEGEAESKDPERAIRPLARWTDKTGRFLICPRCGISEAVEIS